MRERLKNLKERNQANMRLRAFRNLMQKKETGTQISLSADKMAALPADLQEDPDEAVLYIYYSVRYYDEQMFKVILQKTNNMQGASSKN